LANVKESGILWTNKDMGGWVYRMKRKFACAAVLCLSVGLAACEGSAAGTSACANAADVAAKVTALTDALNTARATGKISDERAGEIAGAIMAAGRTKAPAAYCTALDRVRSDAGL
jgi:hypothetical protein